MKEPSMWMFVVESADILDCGVFSGRNMWQSFTSLAREIAALPVETTPKGLVVMMLFKSQYVSLSL